MNCSPQRWMLRVFTLLFLSCFVLTLGLGNLFAQSVQKVSLLGAPWISSLAGSGWDNSGFSGDGAAASAATLYNPYGTSVDSAGNVYIADSENFRIRVVNTQKTAITVAGVTIQPGNIATVVGTGVQGNTGDGGPALAATIGWIYRVAVDGSGSIYFADTAVNVVRKVDASGTITAFAGVANGGCGYYENNESNGDGGAATSATFQCVYGVAIDGAGNVYAADPDAGLIRKINTQGVISTIAGDKASEPDCEGLTASGDGGAATSAVFPCPLSVGVDHNGNLYIADYYAYTVRVVNMQNAAITVAGVTIQPGNVDHIAGTTGTAGYSGDGGPATSGQLSGAYDASVDNLGNVYIADSGNDVIRKVDTNGTITTFAGAAGDWDYLGDGGPATAAALYFPTGVAADAFGNVYIADSENNAIRKVSPNGGGSSTDFGSVALGSNTSQSVSLYMSQAVTISSVQASGDYAVVTLTAANRHKRGHSGSSHFAGPDTRHMSSLTAKLFKRSLEWRASMRPSAVHRNTPGGCIGTFAQGDVCTLNVQFTPTQPGPRWFQLSATDSNQATYTFGLTGTGVGSLVSITPGIIHTPQGGAGIGAATGMVRDDLGNTYVADYRAHIIWKISPQGGVSLVAGVAGVPGYDGDGGLATAAHLNDPISLTLDSVGNLYIADTLNNVIRKVDLNGIITTVAGNGTAGYSGNGSLATNAQLDNPLGVLADKAGNLYIGDTFNNVVRKVDLGGKITTIAGTGDGAGSGGWDEGDPNGGSGGDGGQAMGAQLNGPTGLALDANGNLYVADTWNSAVRRVDGGGTITVVAGLCGEGCQSGYGGDGGPATEAELAFPYGLAVDAAGDFYIADTNNGVIRKVDVNGVITTVAGMQNQPVARSKKMKWHAKARTKKAHAQSSNEIGDGGLATSATIYTPVSVSVDNSGNLYLTDVSMGDVRMVDVTTSDMNFGATNPGSTSDPQTAMVSNAGNATLDFSQISLSANFGWVGGGSCNASSRKTSNNDCQPSLCVTGSSLPSGDSCPLVADFAPPAGGSYSGSIMLTNNAVNSPYAISLEGVGTQPDYAIAADPSTMNIHQGQTGTATLTVTPTYGYAGTIQFGCTGLPALTTCTFSPVSAVFASNTDPIAVTLTVTTTGPTTNASLTAPGSGPNQNRGSLLYAWLLPAGLVGVMLLGGNKRRRGGRQMVLRMLCSFALLTGVMFLNGCSGASQPAAHVTPVGSYSTMVTTTASASGGSGQHQAAITITVVQ